MLLRSDAAALHKEKVVLLFLCGLEAACPLRATPPPSPPPTETEAEAARAALAEKESEVKAATPRGGDDDDDGGGVAERKRAESGDHEDQVTPPSDVPPSDVPPSDVPPLDGPPSDLARLLAEVGITIVSPKRDGKHVLRSAKGVPRTSTTICAHENSPLNPNRSGAGLRARRAAKRARAAGATGTPSSWARRGSPSAASPR